MMEKNDVGILWWAKCFFFFYFSDFIEMVLFHQRVWCATICGIIGLLMCHNYRINAL